MIFEAMPKARPNFLQSLLKGMNIIFTESAVWANSVSKLQCPWVVCLCVCLSVPGLKNFWSKSVSLILAFSGFWVFAKQSTIHNGGISWGRSVAVIVGVSDKWQVTHNTWHVNINSNRPLKSLKCFHVITITAIMRKFLLILFFLLLAYFSDQHRDWAKRKFMLI